MAFDPDKIAEKIDAAIVGGMEISESRFGLEMKTLVDAMEFAKVMSISKQAVPAFLRNEPGLCVAVLTRSIRWGLDPFFVAEQAYLVKNPKTGEEKIAFMAQLFNAVINKAEPLIFDGKLRIRYEGSGDDLKATIYAKPKGEIEAIEFTTPTIGQRIKAVGRNDSGYLKGSPLYDSDPEQALWYYGSRGFIRRYYPHVFAGGYTGEELQEAGFERMRDVTPPKEGETTGRSVRTLADALKDRKAHAGKRQGFDPEHVERETAKTGGAKEGTAKGDAEVKESDDDGGKTQNDEPDAAGQGDDRLRDNRRGEADQLERNGADDAVTRGGADSGAGEAEANAAGDYDTKAQQELIPPEPEGSTARKRRR